MAEEYERGYMSLDSDFTAVTIGVVYLVILGVIFYFMGLGLGGTFAGFAVGGFLGILYVFEPGEQEYKVTFMLITIGAVLGVLFEAFVIPFGQYLVNGVLLGTLAGQIGGGIGIVACFLFPAFAIAYTKIPDAS